MASAVVTGAASGIGRAIATRLSADGWAVVGVDRDQTALDAVVAELHSAVAVVGDVAERQTHRRARAAATECGPLGAWVCAAGITRSHDLTRLDEEAVRLIVDVNQLALLWGAAEAVNEWLATDTHGTIAVISSVHARRAFPHHAAYEMTKAASEALVRSISVTYGPQGIRAVGIAPGAVATPALIASLDSAADPAAARRHLEHQSPAERLAQPGEIAAAVSFLISDQAAYISGTTLTVDGGWSAVLSRAPENPQALRPAAGTDA